MKSSITLLLTVLSLNLMGSSDCAEQAEQILESAGIRGGLVVQLGCGNGSLTATLRSHEGFMVHDLDGDPHQVRQAREHRSCPPYQCGSRLAAAVWEGSCRRR